MWARAPLPVLGLLRQTALASRARRVAIENLLLRHRLGPSIVHWECSPQNACVIGDLPGNWARWLRLGGNRHQVMLHRGGLCGRPLSVPETGKAAQSFAKRGTAANRLVMKPRNAPCRDPGNRVAALSTASTLWVCVAD